LILIFKFREYSNASLYLLSIYLQYPTGKGVSYSVRDNTNRRCWTNN